MKLQDYDVSTKYTARVLNNQPITPSQSKEEVREIDFEIFSPDFYWQVGQNIGVLAPGNSEMGQDLHFRLYSIAGSPGGTDGANQQLSICVRRCNYIDQYNGEEYPGIASNFLCDLTPGDTFVISGPYGQAFEIPDNPAANLILIGAGTGIAPFRAFVKHLYAHHPEFTGKIMLFHGAETGMELIYRNEARDDFALYYDRDTFYAIDALSTRPGWSDATDWGSAIKSRGEELLDLLDDPATYVYLAGIEPILEGLDDALSDVVGSYDKWQERKEALRQENRWVELLYG